MVENTFRSKLTPHKRFICSSGSRFENVYQEEISKKDGRKHLVKTGETNIYEKIQADLESSKVENIVHKLAMGDLSVLKEAKLTYVDATEMPHSLMEAQNIVVKAKGEFDKFPSEVREVFHNSPEEYVSLMGTKEFYEKMSPYNEKMKKIMDEKNLDEYNNRVNETAAFTEAVNKAMKGGENE